MATTDQNPEQENEPQGSPEERLDEIKKEEEEDASEYYVQAESEAKGPGEEEEHAQPVPPVDSEEEEMSLLKAVAFLGFGMAALAIIFILFFIRDLGNKVGDVDSAVQTLEQKFGPLRSQVESGFAKVNDDVSKLHNKFGSYEKMIAVMELKRAKVAIEEVTSSSNPELQAKSSEVVASIDRLLNELGAGEVSAAQGQMPTMMEEAAPAADLAEETPVESAPEPAMEETSEVESEPAPESEPETAAEAVTAEESVADESGMDESAIAAAEEEPAPGVIELESEGVVIDEGAADDGAEDEGEFEDEEL
ncbi:MAG: hypothetical protein ACE5ER_10545 [Nitrospinaceae bacterium]